MWEHKFSAEESKKIIDLLCEKYKLSANIVSTTHVRRGFSPVKLSTKELLAHGAGVIIDIEYFAGKSARPIYNSIGVVDDNIYDTYDSICTSDYLSADGFTEDEAYQRLAKWLSKGMILTKSAEVPEQILCMIEPFSSYEELALKLAVKGED